jgi:Cu-Zn family superoxide dismutase
MRGWTTMAVAAATALLGGCGAMHGHGGMHGSGPMAHAALQPTQGNTAKGMAMFHTSANGVILHARLSGLKPNQEHGFHIHEKGDCSAQDGTSTGGHFNPGGKPHGPQHADHHAGDLPALKADANGNADLRVEVHGLGIGQGAADIVGRGLIVHALPDDYKTQPTGNAGARIACAVIQRVTR